MESDSERALRYRNLAEEFRVHAAAATTDETREAFLRLAKDYDRLAELTEEIAKTNPS